MSRTPSKQDLVAYLLDNYFDTKHQVEQAVKLGIVSVNGKTVKRPGIQVKPKEDNIKLIGETKLFVSRGGYKLQKALQSFGIDPHNQLCMDVGSSTGGFTDCLLQYGAKKVIAVDTGYGQLDWGLRKNSKVQVLEKTNIRHLMPERTYIQEDLDNNNCASLFAVDVSFISILKLIPSMQRLSVGVENTNFIFLIKPQFEAGKDEVGRGGVIRNPGLHQDILLKFIHGSYRAGLDIKSLTYSPITGGAGNIEFLGHFTWPRNGYSLHPNLEQFIEKTVTLAYADLISQ